MDWKQLIADIKSRGLTLQQIKDAAGFSSRGHVHDVAKGARVYWELGDAIIKLHKRVMRRKARP